MIRKIVLHKYLTDVFELVFEFLQKKFFTCIDVFDLQQNCVLVKEIGNIVID